MKKAIGLIVLLGLVGMLLTAAVPVPPPNQSLSGTLQYQASNICGVSYFVPLQVMTNVYLTGKFVPTNGTLRGCQINATGAYYRTTACTYFMVDKYYVDCSAAVSPRQTIRSPFSGPATPVP